MKSLTNHLILIAGLFFIGQDMIRANTNPGYTPTPPGEFEAIGAETRLCPHCEAACSVSDSGAERDQSCEDSRRRAALLANGGNPPTSRPAGREDGTN